MHVAQRVVLLVNGHADSRAVHRAVLEHRGYIVVEADDARGGLRMAELIKPDLVVTEVRCRDDANLDFIRTLKANERTRDVLVIVLSPNAARETEEQAKDAGCARFFLQPLEPSQLLREIEDLIGAPGQR